MGLGIRVQDQGRICQSANKAALTLTLEISQGQVWAPKIMKLLGWMCLDGPYNLDFELSDLGQRGLRYGQITMDYPDQGSQ